MSRIAVLCGTGMINLAEIAGEEKNSEITEVKVQTKWGEVPVKIIQNLDGKIFFIDRHHLDNKSRNPPHMIEHRSNVFAASSCNPDLIISINSVGSLISELPPGRIGIIDDDNVELSNLQRQVIHSTQNIGKPKVDSAKSFIKNINPEINITKVNSRVDNKNIFRKINEKNKITVDNPFNVLKEMSIK